MVTIRTCAAPGCQRQAPGPFNDFCANHFFQVPRTDTTILRKCRIERFNATDDAHQRYLDEQIESYRHVAVSKLPGAR